MKPFVYGRTTYTVEKLTLPPDGIGIAYVLHGPRGARYGLMPNKHRPEMMFAINDVDFTKKTPFDHKWFKVVGDELKISA